MSFNIKEYISYEDLVQGDIDTFFSILLYTGYLSPINEKVKIPNESIMRIFKEKILKWAIGNANVNEIINFIKFFHW